MRFRSRFGRLGAPVLVAAVILLVGAGLWFVKVRQRASGATVQHKVVQQYPGATAVSCTKLQTDGATWACGVVYHVESECVMASVSVFGSLKTQVGKNKCARETTLKSMPPKQPDVAGVTADVARLSGVAATLVRCTKVPGTKTRWACVIGPSAATGCRFVRVVPWQPWKLINGGTKCTHLPALQHGA